MPKRRMTNSGVIRRATADLHRGLKLAVAARLRLARATRPGAAYAVVSRSLQWAQDILDARRRALLRSPNVIGIGLGSRIVSGRTTDEPCITVFVENKKTPEQLAGNAQKPLPKWLSKAGRRIRVDVIEMGEIELQAFPGASIGATNDAFQREGTVGVFARDLETNATVAITAMHVTGEITVTTPIEFSIPSPSHHDANMRRLGVMTFGTRAGVDAGKIELDDEDTVDDEIPTIGRVDGWRPVAKPADVGKSVTMCGAKSGVKSGKIIQVDVDLPKAGLASAIIVQIQATGGDSGAALVDENRHVLGFLVGKAKSGLFAGFQVFCSAAAVVDILDIDF
jgi:hypothetical protein